MIKQNKTKIRKKRNTNSLWITLLGGALWEKKKKHFASIADLNLTTSPHFLTTTLFLRSKGQSSSFSAPLQPFVVVVVVFACFHEKFQLPLSSSSKARNGLLKSSSSKIPAVSLILVISAITSLDPNFKAWKTPPYLMFLHLWSVPPCSQKAFQWGRNQYFQDLGASGSSTEVRLFHGWYIRQSRIQSSLKSLKLSLRWVLFSDYTECLYVCCYFHLPVCFWAPSFVLQAGLSQLSNVADWG